MADHSRPDVEPLAGCADLGPESGAVGQDTRLTVRLRPTNWLHLAAWWTHVVVAVGLGLFGVAITVLVSIVLIFDAVTTTACESATPAPPNFTVDPFAFDPEARARKFVRAMADDEFQAAYEMLAPEQWGADSLCSAGLEGFWQTVASEGDTTLVAVDLSDQPFFGAMYNRLDLTLRLTLATPEGPREIHVELNLLSDGRIAGYRVNEAMGELDRATGFPPPPYAELDNFEDFEVVVGQAPWELPGIITIPVGSGPFPAVVLAGGKDLDGTGVMTKLSRDEAWGLATRGVASLRFDRRTHAHALETARQQEFTIDDELVDDTLAAVEVLRRTPRIDPARVYVSGVSLAGFAAPMVGLRDPSIAGLIIAVAPSGLLHDWVWRHSQYRLGLDGDVTALDQGSIRSAKALSESISAWVAGGAAPRDIAVKRSYYAHLSTYRPEDAAYRLPMPIFVISVERDRTVPPEDAETWIESLRLRRNVAFRLYRGHTHALVNELSLTKSSSDMGVHMSWDVISDMATWISGQWPDRQCADQEAWNAGCRGGH